jgi:phosphatidylserine/phosphatidylglycerophosphate/cardiolipin synthase-like enzyme
VHENLPNFARQSREVRSVAKQPTAKAIDQTIRKNLNKLRKPGVLAVRPGFEIAKHQLTGKSAIVATVHTKKKSLPKADMLPNTIAGIPVDVREATPFQRLRAHDWPAAVVAQTFRRPEEKDPSWPYEREMPSGKPLTDISSMTSKALAQSAASQPAAQQALGERAKKPELPYVPAPNTPLTPVIATTTITAAVSPDAGLATLQAFLDATKKSLVIGMYDFTSGTILQNLETILKSPKTLQMVLDDPAPNPTRNQTDPQTVAALQNALGNRAKIAWALERSDTLASAWIFPYAYHIKVIVRDGTAFWLSSGNLNNSNEPDLASPPTTEDRDWHVVIEDQQLAATFGAYLNQDYLSAQAHQATPASPSTAAVADAHAKLAADTNPPPPTPRTKATAAVPAKTFSNISVKITPLLTPDTLPNDKTKGQYLTNMTQLISSAQKNLYIQLQYIEASDGKGDYDALLQTIAARVTAGVDVRLIESLEYGEKWAEKMKASGVDLTANIWLQPNVHNKGFVVDSSVVVVSSQNFSPSGVQTNRDAGVILESTDLAGYFEPIFLSDWSKLKPFAPKAAQAKARRVA